MFLKKGIVKVSLIMQDEREFNITYLQGPDVVSLYCDCLTQFRDCLPRFVLKVNKQSCIVFQKKNSISELKRMRTFRKLCKYILSQSIKTSLHKRTSDDHEFKGRCGMFLVISFSEFDFGIQTQKCIIY